VLFILSLFISNSVYIQRERRDDFEATWNKLWMSFCDSYYPVFAWRSCGKMQDTLANIDNHRTEIWTWDFQTPELYLQLRA